MQTQQNLVEIDFLWDIFLKDILYMPRLGILKVSVKRHKFKTVLRLSKSAILTYRKSRSDIHFA